MLPQGPYRDASDRAEERVRSLWTVRRQAEMAMCAGLVDRLVARGHRVTLIGAGRDRTAADFVATFAEPPSVRLGEPVPEVLHSAAAGRVLEEVEVDLVHDHTLAGPLLAAGRLVPTVVTAHGPVDGELGDHYAGLLPGGDLAPPGAGRVAVRQAEAPAKRDLLSRAHCLAFPVCWEEPFGMVLVEALACGTPVVALGRGSVPEIVIDGVCGVVCEQPAELPAAIEAAGPSA